MHRRLVVAVLLGLACAAHAQVSVTLPAVPFRPFSPLLAASQVELKFNLAGPTGAYTVDVQKGGTSVLSTQVIKTATSTQLFRVGVPIDEGANQFTVKVVNVAGAGNAASPVTTSVTRELKNTVSGVTLDAILPLTRTTTATSTDLVYTVSGNAQNYQVTATN